jgi:hypothetical protein
MTKRDLIVLTAAPVILFVVALNLLWLAGRLHASAERGLADYAVLEQRFAALAAADSAPRSSARAAITLSRLAAAAHESDAASATLAASLATLLLVVCAFHMLTIVRLRRTQERSAPRLRSESTTSGGAPMRPSSRVTALRSALGEPVDRTVR